MPAGECRHFPLRLPPSRFLQLLPCASCALLSAARVLAEAASAAQLLGRAPLEELEEKAAEVAFGTALCALTILR